MKKESFDFSWINKKVHEEVIAYDIDFYKLFTFIKTKQKNCYFFESLSLPRYQDRYHVIGFDPIALFSARENTLSIFGKSEILKKILHAEYGDSHDVICENPYDALKENFPQNFSCTSHKGGLIGYFSHESINYFEPSLSLEESSIFSTFKLGLYLDGLIYDTLTNTLTYYSYGESRIDLVKDYLVQAESHQTVTSLESIVFKGHSVDKLEYLEAVKKTRQKIIDGYSFQSEVGFKSFFEIKGDKIAIYNKLRDINPSPYMYYLKFDKEELLGASPEILISNKNGTALTTPTAGTTIRGKNAKEDAVLARELLNDPKEISEHNMLVDLHRNDLAKVSKAGSVRIEELMHVIKFSHVQHIVSFIKSELLKNKNSFDLLASTLPGGVTTGAPKIETIKIIQETENDARGPYGGAVGRFGLNGDCDFCLPIRSIFCYEDECYAQTSAGVVYDSSSEKEYKEVLNKLAAMQQVLFELGGEEIHEK